MKEKGAKKYVYYNVSIKPRVAEEFRKFSKALKKPNSEVLEAMIYFFREHHLSPFEKLPTPLERTEKAINKRINALIAILKNMETHKLTPTHLMLEMIVEDFKGDTKGKPLLLEKSLEEIKKKQEEEKIDEHTYYQERYFQTQQKMLAMKRMLQQAKLVTPTFGKEYVRIEITKEQWEKFMKESDVREE